MQIHIDNEYDTLEAVLVHRPGDEIDRLTHDNMRGFLFEDVPYLKRMQAEHDAFVAKMRERGIEVLYLKDHVRAVLDDDEVRARLVETVCAAASMPAIVEDLLNARHWSRDELLDILFVGITASEYKKRTGRRVAAPGDRDEFLLPPAPNAYFSRDPAVVVHEAAISSKMHYRQRIRESLLTRAVLEHHPRFKDNPIAYGGTDEPTEDRPYTIEGGDVVVLSPESVLIGASERTRSETIELLAGKCFQFSGMQRVYEIDIPTERAFMHLDTVFTVIDRGMVLWFADVMQRTKRIFRCEPDADDPTKVRRIPETRSLLEVLREEFQRDVTVIDTAGGQKRFASREQRTDGTNALAVAPRVVITYERNERTTAALEAHGVTCIGIDDSELVRGLGGPRCMTMPLRRRPG
ncbi:MAG: arginine deiminase family protein [Phycisphaerae bacterium]